MVGTVYSYNEWGIMVLKEGEDIIFECCECVRCTRINALVGWV